ncbi:MAG: TonB-dependent receptor [Chitinophagales bacterium]|nr:TonB-dependent receptor [Chitinophagales bacterium]
MKKIIIAIFLLISSFAFAQQLKVLDGITLQPIPNAIVVGMGDSVAVVTDIKGQVDISKFLNLTKLYVSHASFQRDTFDIAELKKNQYTVGLLSKSIDLDAVVIAAQRTPEVRRDIAQQIVSIDSKELSWVNQQTSADVLIESGEVFVQKSQAGGGSPVLRGLEANEVLLVVDGIRMNNAIYRAGHLQNIITVDNNMLEKMEVVFGPGSVMYGSDALGGVISFTTRMPELGDSAHSFNFKGNAFARFSSANLEKTGHIDLNFGGRRFGSFTSVTFSDFDDLRQGNNRNPFYGDWGKRLFYVERINGIDSIVANSNPNNQRFSGYYQYDILQKFLFKQSSKVSHILNFQFSNSSDIPRYDRLTDTRNGAFRFAEWYYGPQKRLLAAYQLQLSNTRWYDRAQLSLAFQDIEESRINRRLNNDNKVSQIEKVKIGTVNFDLSKRIGTKNELNYGLEATYNDVNSTAFQENIATNEEGPAATRYPNGGSNMYSVAAYLSHYVHLKDWLVLNEGIRYSFIGLNADFGDTTFFPFPFREVNQQHHALSGSLGLVFNLPKGFRIALAGSTGFRAPNVDDLAKVFESVTGNVIVPNPDLKPKYTYSGELTLGYIRKDRLQLEATGYYNYITNAFNLANTTLNGLDSVVYQGQLSQVQTNINLGKAYITGFSAGFQAFFNKYISLSSKVTFTYGRIITDTTDQPLDHIPPIYGRTGLNYQRKQFQGEFYVLYNGWKHLADYNLAGEDNFVYATQFGNPAWYTLNLRLAYQVNRYLRAQIAMENILDKNYRYFASGLSAAGRNLMVTLRVSF